MPSFIENAVILWSWPMAAAKLANDMAETMLGAQRVISARMPALQAAVQSPFTADHVELGRMVSEKVEAFATSGRTVSNAGVVVERITAANRRAFTRVASGAVLWPTDWLSLFEQNIAAAATLVALPAAALAPIHSGVMSNDKRLATK